MTFLTHQLNSTLWATITFEISPTIMAKVHGAWKTSRSQLGATVDFVSSMTWQSVPSPPAANNPNSFGFSSSSTPQKNLVLVLISDFYSNPGNASAISTSLCALINSINSLAQGEGIDVPYVYLNYAAPFQDPLGSTGQEMVQRAVARKYDPRGFFQTRLRGGFKLFPQ